MQKILATIEQHAEKGVLGLCAVVLLWAGWSYLLSSPNRIAFDGAQVGPADLNTRIRDAATSLDAVVQRATSEEPNVPDYSGELKQLQEGGLARALPKDGPRLDAAARAFTPLGQPIDIPGLTDGSETMHAVRLANPLRPTTPVVVTGISVARPNPAASLLSEAPRATASDPAFETSWVTVASWFDADAQRTALIKDYGYPGFLARVYVTGMDVQRQEMLASGEWGEWKDVRPDKAGTSIQIPDPVFDESTGALLNKEELDKAFQLVRSEQARLMQPPFLAVEGGDYWDTPPLPGLESDEDEAEETRTASARQPTPRQPAARQPVAPPARPSPGGFRGGGDGVVPGGKGGSDIASPGGGGGGPSPQAQEARRRADERRKLRQEMSEAKRSFGSGRFEETRGILQRIIGHADVTESMRREAENMDRVVGRIQRARLGPTAPQAPSAGGGIRGLAGDGVVGLGKGEGMVDMDGVSSRFGAQTFLPTPGSTGSAALPEIKHPNSQAPAVWFHDDTVQPGKTYRYRGRVRLWNRFVGRMKSLVDPQGAKIATIAGEWSLPSEPVTVAPSSHFFVTGPASTRPNAAAFEVWKWRKGMWLKNRFEVEIGDTIGGIQARRKIPWEFDGDKEVVTDVDFSTGAVVLDIRTENVKVRLPGKGNQFSHSTRPSLVVTYLDPADGQVKERSAALDATDPMRNRLRSESFE